MFSTTKQNPIYTHTSFTFSLRSFQKPPPTAQTCPHQALLFDLDSGRPGASPEKANVASAVVALMVMLLKSEAVSCSGEV